MEDPVVNPITVNISYVTYSYLTLDVYVGIVSREQANPLPVNILTVHFRNIEATTILGVDT